MAEEIASRFRGEWLPFCPAGARRDISALLFRCFICPPGRPGSVISAEDLDNRIKTLVDTLRRPRNVAELRGSESLGDCEDPFYCLLEDDNLVTQLKVGTDLDPPEGAAEQDRRRVQIVVTVELKPYDMTCSI